MKNWKKETKIRVGIGLCMIMAAVIFGILLSDHYIGPDSAMWQRMTFITVVLGTGLSGFLGMFIAWGFLAGYGFVLLVALPHALPDPWNRYYAVVYLGLLFLLPSLKKKKQQKKTASKPASEEFEELFEEDLPSFSAPPMIVQQTTNGRFFQLIRFAGELRCYRVGGELKGLHPEQLQDPNAHPRPMGKQDFAIPRSEITGIKVKLVNHANMGYNKVAILKAGKRTYRFAPVYLTADETFYSFWPSISPKMSISQKKDDLVEETASMNPDTCERLQKVKVGLSVYLGVVSLCWLFLKVPYKLFSAFSMVTLPVILILYAVFPNEITIVEDAKNTKKVSMVELVMLSGIPLALRTLMDFNYIEAKRMIVITGTLIIVVTVMMLLLTKEWRKKKMALVAIMFSLIFYAPGAVGQVNYLLDFHEPVQHQGVITDMRISTSSKGGTWYYIDVRFTDGSDSELHISKEEYQQLQIGDSVNVPHHPGALGIKYFG